MKTKISLFPLFLIFLLPLILSVSLPPSVAFSQATPKNSSQLHFIENIGQFDPRAHFRVQSNQGTLWLADNALWLTLLTPLPDAPYPQTGTHLSQVSYSRLGINIKLSFVNANTSPQIMPFDRRQTSINYLLGHQSTSSYTDAPGWAGVRYLSLYPGIALEITGTPDQFQFRLVCHTDCAVGLQQMRLQIEGAESFHFREGQLILITPAGEITLPLAYVPHNASTSVNLIPHWENNTLSFTLSEDNSSQLTPSVMPDQITSLHYGTFLGGTGNDGPFHSVVDDMGNIYVVGFTSSPDFPTTPGTFDPTHNGSDDLFVLKINPTGTELIYATFLGGDENDVGYSIAVDDTGHAYVTGFTRSTNFPTTPGAYDTTFNGQQDAFIAKLNPPGNALAYATFLGGSEFDAGGHIVVDGMGYAYVTGTSFSTNFPVTPGVFDTTHNGNNDIFVARLDPAGSNLIYATYVGGEANEFTVSAALDATGNIYVGGQTGSSDFPTTPGAFDTSHNGGSSDGFVFKLNSTGTALAYASFLGGSGADNVTRVAVDNSGHLYVTGETSSANFPTTIGAFDSTYNGMLDAFVVKFNPSGTDLVYATFLGSSGSDSGWDIALNDAEHAHITGRTNSVNFPITPDAFDFTHNGGYDVFIARLNFDGSDLLYGSFLGGSNDDEGFSISLDKMGRAYITGLTGSSDFPTTPGAFDPTHNGNLDGFLTKLTLGYISVQADFFGSPTNGIIPLAVLFTNLSTGDYDTCLWDFGDGATSPVCHDPTYVYTSWGTYTVTLTLSGPGGTATETKADYIFAEPRRVFLPLVLNYP